MAASETTTSSLSDSLQTIIASARLTRVAEGKIKQFCDNVTLDDNTGLSWHEISMDQITAQTVTETTKLDNPQELSDTKFSVTPSMIGVLVIVTDRTARRIASKVYSQIGQLGQMAIEKKVDVDGLTMLDAATTSLCGAATTLTSGYITAADARVRGNSTEPWSGSTAFFGHSYQVKDLKDEIIAGVGTYSDSPAGSVVANVFQDGSIQGKIGGVTIVIDDNITIDSAADAKGGVFASGTGGALVCVQGKAPWFKEVRDESFGGGATKYYHYDEYAFGERSSGNWLYEIYSDATAPTS